ncbi:MAG: carnitine 3-dehydrogenase [Pseudomonadota bacterium]
MNRKAAIVGGGVIGGGWAARFLLNGWDVSVADPDPEAARKIDAVLDRARRMLPMLYERAMPGEGRLTITDDLEGAVDGAAWVQESVPERIEIKRAVFSRIAAAVAPGVPVGSSTSGYKPSDLAEGLGAPGAQVMVAHPFVPVYLLPLVEVVGHPGSDPAVLDQAETVLRAIGMAPLRIRAEIDAHVADRFLEGVWREALWLVRDGIATTEEIDDAIRLGFGLRWAQMGLFETYRLGGGEGGMAQFVAQFAPALEWPWSRLTDVPTLDAELSAKIASQSDAQSGHLDPDQLARLRDDNLVSILRALKARGSAAGAVLATHEESLPDPATAEQAEGAPLITLERTVPIDWTDYNGHMNESRYGQVFSDAADGVMRRIGADAAYIADGLSYFTADIRIRFLAELHAGARIRVESQVLEGKGKKLRLFHRLLDAEGAEAATAEQFLLHVSLETRRSCVPREDVAARLEALAAAHAQLLAPDPAARLP